MKFPLALLLFFVGVSVLAADDKDAAKKDLAKFQGTWIFESREFEGEREPVEHYKACKLFVKDNTLTLVESFGIIYRATIKLDPTKELKEIDVTFTGGPEEGKTRLGIYELDDDTYRICINVKGNDRPTEFTAKKDSGQALDILKKVRR
ncbi:MAG: TIGR03067 domain-containing protein [Gemmataceae bacterium]